MENLNTDDLMKLQVEQLEKEKKDLNQRLRVIAKRVDHIERAYRKEERPLLDQDYEEQQAHDRLTFENLQKARIEGSKIAHLHNIETKKRLSRMIDDYLSRREVVGAKRGDDHARKLATAARKIEEEKAKRRNIVLQQREEERLRLEKEEKSQREKIEEEARLEAGTSMFVCVCTIGPTRLLQNVSPKSDVFAKRPRLLLLPPKRPNAKQKQRQRLCANSGKKNGLLLLKQRVSKCNARRRP
jgi:hypothetical protein